MRTTIKMPASLGALALLVACDVGEPVIASFGPVEPQMRAVPKCLQPSMLCDTLLPDVNGAVAARALSLSSCVPTDLDGDVDEGDALANCAEPPSGADWLNADVLVHADEPREVVLAGVRVVNMRIRLDGPVTLILRELTELTNLELATTSPEAAVVLDDVTGAQVTIGDASTPFAGHVDARHSRLDRLSVVAESFELDSTMIIQSFVSADFLNSGDGFLWDVALELGDALFAPSRLQQARILRCETLAFFAGTVTESVIPRCESDEPTRIYNVEIKQSVVDGLILGEGGKMELVQLGRRDPSDFVLWGVGVVGGSMFCDQAVRLKSTDSIRCSHCTEAAFGAPDDDACNLEMPAEERTDAKSNLCEALNLETECTGDVPERVRPIADYWL